MNYLGKRSHLAGLARIGLAGIFFLAGCQPAPVSTFAPVEGLPVKIGIEQSGIYQVDSAALNLTGADSKSLHLYHNGTEVPLFVGQEQNGNFALRFYAQAAGSRYTHQDVYWLGTQPPAASEAPALIPFDRPQCAEGFSPRIDRLEENLLYWPMSEQVDPWFWKLYAAPSSENFVLSISAQPVGTATLTVALAGKTSAPANPDHSARLVLNQQVVLQENWEGSGQHLLRVEVPEGLLHSGENDLTLEFSGLPEVAAEVAYLDWIAVEYAAPLTAQGDALEFIAGEAALQLSGFSGKTQVYDITDPRQPVLAMQSDAADFSFTGQAGRRYLAVGPNGALAPLGMSGAQLQPDLRDSAMAADLLVVGPPDLLAAVQPLLDWRAQTGVQGMAVPLQAVYDQFSSGIPGPEAIRELVRASRGWTKAPRSLLLLGDYTFDPLGYQAPAEANRLPVFFVFTEYGGETASDLPFVDLDGDYLPDLAVGRLPARTPQQISTYVQKVLDYEKNLPAGGRLVVSVADGQEASFAQDARNFMDLLPAGMGKLEIAPPAGAVDVAEQVIQAFEQSPWLVAYFGHGSLSMWGKDKLFTLDDVALLPQTDHAPIVINMTCLAGLFIHPKQESLAEGLLWKEKAGAAAVLAPTSLTLTMDQSLLSRPLILALTDGKSASLGDAALRAWRQMPVDTSGARDVLQTFLLLGDPELRLEVVP